jgi:glutathione synthase/RimK-type ligase-like ATP-grasp enzyme
MKLRVLPYKAGSKSARELVNQLSPKAIMKKQRTPVKGRKKLLLNWGHSNPAFSLTGVTVLNAPSAVAIASNKLSAFRVLQSAGVRIPEFTNDINVAKGWIEDERIVLCRTLLRANSGRGIFVAKTTDQLVSAPMYVKYIRKEKEYRLHVFKGQVIDAVEKRRRSGFGANPAYNKYIRSYEQGWVMTRDGISVSDDVKAEAIKAVAALGLDFGAVDVVINRDDEPVVLEVNTAPGIQGTTLQSYKRAVESWLSTLSSR